MPSEKAARSARRKALRNSALRSRAKTAIAKARRLITQGDLALAQEAVNQAVMALDKAARKGVLHPNNAARRKSRLLKLFNTALATRKG